MTQTSSPRQKIQRRPVHGVLLLDKPLGLSSNQALQKAKWLLRADKAGHTGTLDPLATGVLPLCFGAATKFSQLQLEADKTYEAVLLRAKNPPTADAEGEVIETRPVPEITPELLADITQRFTGPLAQVPPMYSALKKDGKALYEYARQGIEVERAARHITIFKLNMAVTQDPCAQAAIKIIVSCSKGTYIRTLGEDIGEALGCGACLLPPQSLVADYPSVTLDAEHAGRFLSGLRRRGEPGQWGADAPLVQVYGPAASAGQGSAAAVFLGTAHITADELIPQRLLNPLEIREIEQSALMSASPGVEAQAPVSTAAPLGAVSFQH